MSLLSELQDRFRPVLQNLAPQAERFVEMIVPAKNREHGDYQANVAMPLAKILGKPPRDVAQEVIESVDLDDFCEPPEIAGPGFINLRLKTDVISRALSQRVADSRLGVDVVAEPETIIIDYSGPNVAKPMHVGHLRSTVIGAALYNVLTFLGHKVVGDNHIGDWGTQFGMIIYGYRNFLDEEAYRANPVEELARLYRLVTQIKSDQKLLKSIETLPAKSEAVVKASNEAHTAAEAAPEDKKLKKAAKKAKAEAESVRKAVLKAEEELAKIEADTSRKQRLIDHPDIEQKARDETAKLHQGDAGNLALWREFMPHCLKALDEMYDRLGIRFDLINGESHYHEQLGGVVAQLDELGILQQSDGATVYFSEGDPDPIIVRKSDGAYTYATTDLATLQDRVERMQGDRLLYVVGVPQAKHFQFVFEIANKWGYTDAECVHVGFGSVLDPETGQMYRTRSGSTVGLESLLDEAVSRAGAIVAANDDAKPNGPELDNEQRAAIAEAVGIGAIKFADLRVARDSDYKFIWEQMLSTTGDSGPYLQYAHARTAGIFRKGEVDPETLRDGDTTLHLTEPAERELALKLLGFPEAIDAVLRDYRPHLLTEYLLELAKAFSQFFDQCPVLKSEGETKLTRLRLCDLTARTIRLGLNLLGIQAPERM